MAQRAILRMQERTVYPEGGGAQRRAASAGGLGPSGNSPRALVPGQGERTVRKGKDTVKGRVRSSPSPLLTALPGRAKLYFREEIRSPPSGRLPRAQRNNTRQLHLSRFLQTLPN